MSGRATGSRRWWSRVLAGVGVVLVVAGGIGHAGAALVDGHLTRPRLYESALADSAAYRRLYSEVLTDPSVRRATDRVLGQFSFGGRDIADTVALSNAVLRLALPPDAVRDIAGQLIEQALAYIRGDVDRLDTSVDIAPALDDAGATGGVVIRSVLATASTDVLDDLRQFEAALSSFADQLAAGRIPTSIPVVGGRTVTVEQVLAVLDRYPLPAAVREQAEAALRSGDEREALIAAAVSFAESHLAVLSTVTSTSALRIDPMALLGSAGAESRRDVVERLDAARAVVRWVPPWTRFAGLALVALGIALIVWVLRRRPLVALVLVGAALLSAAALFNLVWWSVSRHLDSPLAALATADRAGAVPSSVAAVAGDVDHSLAAQLGGFRVRQTASLVVLGAAVLAVALAIVVLRRIRRWPAVAAVGVLVIGGLGGSWLLSEGANGRASRECNGHAELCDRPYDTVVQAATHNAMSSPDVVQIWPDQDAGIDAQLAAGVRTLLIDTKYWPAIPTPSALSTAEQALPPDLQASLFQSLGERLQHHPGTYLCHSRCAYGAVPLTTALQHIRGFLDDDPGAVVTLIIENGISTADTVAAFEASGISRYLFDGATSAGWPTLGQLIERGQRLVVFAEAAGAPPAWYRSYATDVQDTEYHVISVDQLSCDLKRGSVDAPLFLLNHWIEKEAPDRADAVTMNQPAFIVDRARRCAAVRGQLPNFIAVDFFSIGDVVGAVDELNGVTT